jgi:hypothetical protein
MYLYKIFANVKITQKNSPLVGLEPTTYGLEVHRAIQLRYKGLLS